MDPSAVWQRDSARRQLVEQILAAGGAHDGADFYHAAMVFQHGPEIEDSRRAHELALHAVTLDPANAKARWLCCASEDRLLQKEGKPQRWGTQFDYVDGRWQIAPTDDSVDDAERARWNVPLKDEQLRRADRMNRGESI
jgi:hypothetical protein